MRWIVSIIFDADYVRIYHVEELSEIQGIVELGPDWNTISRIEIKLNRQK